ncbi:MAG: S9 family peptidase [Gammaproteobacteria bacterium]|jgi:dipeptidyl aminopeptidase/acylaminoacyl peptidase|nr:S9 family peptidase [Gammaproteobacteria bacterium]MBT5603832.1 S9 family peptidase [Gammaproteobacteria bacterium]
MHKLFSITLFYGISQLGMAENEPSAVFSADDVFNLEYVDAVQVAPDGKSVLYRRKSNDIMTDSTGSSIWMVDLAAASHRPLLTDYANYSWATWSPDGSRIAYVVTDDSRAQIQVYWLDTGRSAVVASVAKKPADLSWSPDNLSLAFTMKVPIKATPLVKPRIKPEHASWAEPAKVISSVRYQFDGRGIVAPESRQIFIVPAEGGTPRQLTQGAYQHGGPLSWTTNSRSVLFSANRHKNWELETIESDLFLVDTKSLELTQVTNDPGAESAGRFSPDGGSIVYISEENKPLAYRHRRLKVLSLEESTVQVLLGEADFSVSSALWSDAGRTISFQYDQKGRRKIGSVDLRNRFKEISDQVGGTSLGRPYLSGGFHYSNGTYAFSLADEGMPAELGVIQGGSSRKMTSLNEDVLGHKTLAKVTPVTYLSSLDNQVIHGWYLTPPDFDPTQKYPLILEIHGGPHSAYGNFFSAELQLLAAQGYIVFYDNYRGSTSYGAKFASLLQYKYASRDDFTDHMSGIDEMVKLGFVDENNLFVAGGSAGGIGAAFAIGLTNRFNAAVAAKPVINWISKTLTADSSVYQIRHQFPGMPWQHLDHYWSRSPLSQMASITTPTMILTGELDRRTPISESEQFYQALKLKGVDSVMVRLPDSSHGIAARPSRLIAKVDYILAWFERYRKSAPGLPD